MVWLKNGKNNGNGKNSDNGIAALIVELGRLHDPEVKEFPNDAGEAAKVLQGRVLQPSPEDFGYDHTLDVIAAARLLEVQCNLRRSEDIAETGQVTVVLEYAAGKWYFEIIINRPNGKVVRYTTRRYKRRVEAALEAVKILKRHFQLKLLSS